MRVLLAPEALLMRFGFYQYRSVLTRLARSGLRLEILILALLVVILSGGCGKKGDPLPPLRTEAPIIKDLRAENRADGILLSWSIPRIAERGRRCQIRVLRTEGAVSCKECPEEWKLVAEMVVDFHERVRRREGRMNLLDPDVSEGTLYRYRISSKMQPEEMIIRSNTVQIRRCDLN